MYSTGRRDKVPQFGATPPSAPRNPQIEHWQNSSGEMVVDGGESTTSSNDSSPLTRSTDDDETTAKYQSGTATPNARNNRDSIADVVLEEDDLASVISDQQSPSWQNVGVWGREFTENSWF